MHVVWLQSGQEGRSSISSPDQETCGRQFTETWLVLEYCDKGNLQDAVDRGVFNRPHRAGSMDGPNPPKHFCNVVAVRCVHLPRHWFLHQCEDTLCEERGCCF